MFGQVLKYLKLNYKKGGSIFLLPFFVFVVSCSDYSKYGQVVLHKGADKSASFSFSVSDEFISANSASPQDKERSKMSKAEVKLLESLMKEKKYCLNEDNKLDFTVTSRQEKIYDMTFAHLIEESYNAKPLAPRTYFGKCN